jgi:DNA-binding beta-propeller fold protein YncE
MDLETGCAPTSPAYVLDGADSVAISPDGGSVYVVANSGSGEGLVDWFSRNSSTGALTFQGCIGDGAGPPCVATSPTNALGEPESVAVSADGRNVYVASFYAGVVDVLVRNTSTGELTYEGCIGDDPGSECTTTDPTDALDGADSVAVSADGGNVYVGSSDSINMFSRDASTGALSFVGCIGEDAGCTATTPANAVVGVRGVTVSADGGSVYATNFAFGQIDVFSREPSTGALTYESCIGRELGSACATTIGSNALTGAYSIAASPSGGSVYVASTGDAGSGGITAFSRTATTGGLAYRECFGEATGCAATAPVDALQQAYSVAVSPDGASVYAASEEPNALALFSRNASTGALAYQSCIGNDSGCLATEPKDALDGADSLVVSPDGAAVYAASGAALSELARAAASPPVCSNVEEDVAFQTPAMLHLSCTATSDEPLTYEIVSGPEHGTLGSLGSSGVVTYTPANGYSGPDSFTYLASDAAGDSKVAMVALTVVPPLIRSIVSESSPSGSASSARGPQTSKAIFEGQRITLTTPSPLSCTASGRRLDVMLDSISVGGSKSTAPHFSSAAFYLDKGIRHVHEKVEPGRAGRQKTVTSVTYEPNATVSHLPVTLKLSVGHLKPGSHTLTVEIFYRKTRLEHRRRRTVKVRKTLTLRFTIC